MSDLIYNKGSQTLDSLLLLQSVMESMADALLVLDLNDNIVFFNRKLLQMWDLPHPLSEGPEVTSIFPQLFLDRVKEPKPYQAKLQQIRSQPNQDYIDRIVLKNGHILERFSNPHLYRDQYVGRVIIFRDITEYATQETKLLTVASRFRRLWESHLIGVQFTDLQGRIKDANDYILTLLGYSRAELEAGVIRCDEITPPEYEKVQNLALQEIKASGVFRPYEKEYVRKDGSRVHVLVGGALLEGSVEDMVTIVLDISPLKKTEAELKITEARFRLIFESAPVGITLLDMEGQLVKVNPTLCSMLNYSEAEIKKKGIQGITYPDDYHTNRVLLQQLVAGQRESFQMEKRYRPKDGPPFWALLNVSLGRTLEGIPLFAIGIILNIHKERTIREDLKISEERFRTIFESSDLGIALIDRKGNILKVNPALTRILGHSEKEIQCLGVQGVTHPDDFGICWVKLSQLAAGQIDHYEMEKRYLCKGGKTIWCHLICTLVRDLKADPFFIIAMLTDMTERKHLEEERDKLLFHEWKAHQEAIKALRVHDDFLAIASHEMRTPLTPLKFQVQIMRKKILEGKIHDPEHRSDLLRMLDISDQQVTRLKELIDNMIDVSRLRAGQMILTCAFCDLSKIVKRVTQRLSKEIHQAGCSLDMNLSPQVQGHWDSLRLEQVFSNLLTNALKYGKGKKIQIKTWREGAEAKLSVRDFGIGISKQEQKRIFGEFERLGPLDTYGGFGLGLYLTKQIVQAHEGSISVESELHQGATFTIGLPLDPE